VDKTVSVDIAWG